MSVEPSRSLIRMRGLSIVTESPMALFFDQRDVDE